MLKSTLPSIWLALVLLVQGSLAYGAEAPTVNDVVVIANDGNTSADNFGPYYIRADMPWDKWFAAQDKFPFLLIHNPGGHTISPMQLLQFRRMTDYAKANPKEADAKARADWKAFNRGGKARSEKGLWWGIYCGGLDTIPGEIVDSLSAKGVQERVIKELKPAIDAGVDMICFDMEQGPKSINPEKWTEREKKFYGKNGTAALLVNYFGKKDIEFVIEPCSPVGFPLYAKDSVGNLMQDIYWVSREYTVTQRRALGLAGRGDSRWATGSHAAQPLLRPDPTKKRVYRKVDTLNETKANKLLHVQQAREAGHVPCVPILHYLPEMEVAKPEPQPDPPKPVTLAPTKLSNPLVYNFPLNAGRLGELVENPELAAYDWSGTSVGTIKNGKNPKTGLPFTITNSIPVTLTGPSTGVASGHNHPNVGSQVFFRAKDGTIHAASVVAVTELQNDVCLIRFAAPLDAKLKRYRLATNPDAVDRKAWRMTQGLELNECNMVAGDDRAIAWYPTIDQRFGGSGRPVFLPLSNGELVVLGFSWRTDCASKPIRQLEAINAWFGDGEHVQTVEVPK